MMEPSVSVPIVTAAMFAAAAIAEPLLEEHGVADGTYGFCINNPKSIDVALQQWFLGLQENQFAMLCEYPRN
jgi:exosome complex RNA-binding protein Rrp42 (RNase PH superfamily)